MATVCPVETGSFFALLKHTYIQSNNSRPKEAATTMAQQTLLCPFHSAVIFMRIILWSLSVELKSKAVGAARGSPLSLQIHLRVFCLMRRWQAKEQTKGRGPWMLYGETRENAAGFFLVSGKVRISLKGQTITKNYTKTINKTPVLPDCYHEQRGTWQLICLEMSNIWF